MAWSVPPWVKALMDILLLVLPGGGEARQVVQVGEDLIPVANEVAEWAQSPAGQKILGDLEKLAPHVGSAFKASATINAAVSYSAQQGIRGGSRGGLMPPGM